MNPTKPTTPEDLVIRVTEYVQAYMMKYDASHDYNHIQRVLSLSQQIYSAESQIPGRALSPEVVILAALLHDVGDKKYLEPGDDASTMIHKVLVDFGADTDLAAKVQTICLGVSYSSEMGDPGKVVDLIKVHPELAVVQDADRLDAIGAVGIGRVFTFGGAKNRPMEDTLQHFEDKLLRIQDMMKTDAGRRMAKERTERLTLFKKWWEEETALSRDVQAAAGDAENRES